MYGELSSSQKDKLLGDLLRLLAARRIAHGWAALREPATALTLECRSLAADASEAAEFRTYLSKYPVIEETVETLLSHLAMTANVRWQDVSGAARPLARRGWHIARWIPTFLVIDGPLGRFLTSADSPLNSLLRREFAKYPVLAQARDAFNHDLFRRLRNGIGHWSFRWEEASEGSRIVCLDWESSEPTATISLLEAEALHLLSFSVIEALDTEVFRVVNPRSVPTLEDED
jgi:hypothetical protein